MKGGNKGLMIRRFYSDKHKKEYFTEIYRQSFNYVYSYIFARTAGDSIMTEEIVQDTFAEAWTALDRFRGECAIETWLCSISRNKLYERYRKKTAAEKHEFTDTDLLSDQESDFDVEAIVAKEETHRLVLDTLNSLNDLYRIALIMKYLDGSSMKQIAAVTNKSPKAVDGILQRARSRFMAEYMKTVRKEM